MKCREKRKDSYMVDILRKKGGCQAPAVTVAAELTEHGISNAVKLKMPDSKAGWDSTVGGTA